jgi:hypothetical protein
VKTHAKSLLELQSAALSGGAARVQTRRNIPILDEYTVFCCVSMRDRSQSNKSQILTISPSKNAFLAVPMMGFEPIPRFSRERILSPLRLPFRHIGILPLLTSFYLAKTAFPSINHCNT